MPITIETFPMMTKEDQRKAIHWDSDGQQLMVDNGASASITPYLTGFIVPPQPINSKVKELEDMPKQHIRAQYNGRSKMTKGSRTVSHCQTPISLLQPHQGFYVLNTWLKLPKTIILYCWAQER